MSPARKAGVGVVVLGFAFILGLGLQARQHEGTLATLQENRQVVSYLRSQLGMCKGISESLIELYKKERGNHDKHHDEGKEKANASSESL